MLSSEEVSFPSEEMEQQALDDAALWGGLGASGPAYEFRAMLARRLMPWRLVGASKKRTLVNTTYYLTDRMTNGKHIWANDVRDCALYNNNGVWYVSSKEDSERGAGAQAGWKLKLGTEIKKEYGHAGGPHQLVGASGWLEDQTSFTASRGSNVPRKGAAVDGSAEAADEGGAAEKDAAISFIPAPRSSFRITGRNHLFLLSLSLYLP